MNRESVNRSLVRLGIAGERNLPDIFVEFELALAVSRFGLIRILSRMFYLWRAK
jgi:hypothetical protein